MPMSVVEPVVITDPVAECWRRVRDACQMPEVQLAQKVAVLELVKAEIVQHMLSKVLPEL